MVGAPDTCSRFPAFFVIDRSGWGGIPRVGNARHRSEFPCLLRRRTRTTQDSEPLGLTHLTGFENANTTSRRIRPSIDAAAAPFFGGGR